MLAFLFLFLTWFLDLYNGITMFRGDIYCRTIAFLKYFVNTIVYEFHCITVHYHTVIVHWYKLWYWIISILIYHTIYTELWGILWYFHWTMSKIMNSILSKVILIPDSESCYIRKAHGDLTKLNLSAQWIDCMISLCFIIACCSGSRGPVIWDGNWVKHVSCVLHSCKHADPHRKISLCCSHLGQHCWPFDVALCPHEWRS